MPSRDSGESHRPLTATLLKSIVIHLPFLSRFFCAKVCPLLGRKCYIHQLYHDTAPICIARFLQKYQDQGSVVCPKDMMCRKKKFRGQFNFNPTKCSQDRGCISQASATPWGQPKWTGPVAKGFSPGKKVAARVAIQGASERDPNPPDPKILKNY